MADEGHEAAEPIPSYLIECLTWNVPKDGFGQKLLGHYWTDRGTSGEIEIDNRQKKKFQTFQSAKAYYESLRERSHQSEGA